MGRLIKGGMDRKQVAIIFDAGISTLYKKFPANVNEPLKMVTYIGDHSG
ncbi:helix-turn-helix domain-containing protein [Escherichia coli]|nr:helix-turn-helix domain-containing protein [Escherichia coli]